MSVGTTRVSTGQELIEKARRQRHVTHEVGMADAANKTGGRTRSWT